MRIKDISKQFPSGLENDRDYELKSRGYFAEGSREWKRRTKRIALIDAQIAATADRHVAWLMEMQATCKLAKDKVAYQARIEEIKAGQNAGSVIRWSNDEYAETAKAAGGVLVIKMEAL